MIRDVQDRTGGFRAFIPWTYQPENNHLKGRTQATSLEYLRLIAVARLFFDNVAHLQSSWLTTGKDVGQLSLHMGVDDLGSIMLEENVISSAGARHRSNLHELIWLIRTAGRIPAQRDTLYRHLRGALDARPTTRPTSGCARTSRRSRCPAVASAGPASRRLSPRAREPRLAGQAAARGRGDVRRRGPALRPDQHRAVVRAGPVLAAGHPGGARRCARASAASTWPPAPACPPRSWPGPARYVVGVDLSLGMLQVGHRARPAVPLLAGDALRAAVRGRDLRRGDHLVRAAQHRRHRGRAAGDGPGHPARRPAGGVRVQRPGQRRRSGGSTSAT